MEAFFADLFKRITNTIPLDQIQGFLVLLKRHLLDPRWRPFILIVALAILSILLGILALSVSQSVTHSTPPPIGAIPTKPSAYSVPTQSDCPWLDEDSRTPRLISIPNAYIENACMESVGVADSGELGDPQESFMNFGYWMDSRVYNLGKVAVYTCHNSFNPEKFAVCDDLDQVAIGDTIVIELNSGKRQMYAVAEAKILPLAEVDMAEFLTAFDPIKQGLSIMTCAGIYDTQIGDASHRLLIRAVSID